LVVAEGGTNEYHAVTVFNSKNLKGPYLPNHANPIITHRHLEYTYPIVKTGHADWIKTQNGEWWSVLHAKRPIDGFSILCRETFLAKLKMTHQESGLTPIYNPGIGLLQLEQKRPDLPWTPVPQKPTRDNFDKPNIDLEWICLRSPKTKWHEQINGNLILKLRPQVIDSLVNPSFLAQRIRHHNFEATTKMNFQTNLQNEKAGLVIYRKSSTHYQLLKENGKVVLIKTTAINEIGTESKKEVIATLDYDHEDIYLKAIGNQLEVQFYFGKTLNQLIPIGNVQDLSIVSDEVAGRFNGTVIGLYATSLGNKSKNEASFEWFEYEGKEEK